MHRPASLLVLALLGACYHFVPVGPDSLSPGSGVRVRISAAQAEHIAPLLGRTDARLLVGRFVAAKADTLIVEVPIVQSAGAQALHQRLGIPHSSLVELESRTLDRKRTTIAAGVAALVVGSLLVKNLVIDPGRETGPGGSGGNELVPRSSPIP